MSIVGPFGEVNRRDDSTLARHSRIALENQSKSIHVHHILQEFYNSHIMIGQHHWIDLHGVNQIGVVTNKT